MKTYSVKIGSEGKSAALYAVIAGAINDGQYKKPLDCLLGLVDGDVANVDATGATGENLVDQLGLNDNELADYGNNSEADLISEVFLDDDGELNLAMVKKCMVAMAKSDFSRRATGNTWAKREDKMAHIDDIVNSQMEKNNAINDDKWWERVLINTKWISVNAKTSMSNADEYLGANKELVDSHNESIRTVDGVDFGSYFNRRARAAMKKALKGETVKTSLVAKVDDDAGDDDAGVILGADGEPL